MPTEIDLTVTHHPADRVESLRQRAARRYRLVTNGAYWLVQRKVFGLFWCRTTSYAAIETRAEAQALLDRYVRRDMEERGPWTPA